MTVYVLGKGDRIGFGMMHPTNSPHGYSVSYVNPSRDAYYSKYGFAHPINYEGIPYRVLLDGMKVPSSSAIAPFSSNHEFIVVDVDGEVWFSAIRTPEDNEGPLVQVSAYVDKTSHTGWWFKGLAIEVSEESSMIYGFLMTDPSEEDVDTYFKKYVGGITIDWFSISEIKEKINLITSPLNESSDNTE